MIYNRPDRLFFSGCSFTCSTSDVNEAVKNLDSWADYIVKKTNPKFINNFALTGGGNNAICTNLSYLIESQTVASPENSLILFNITGLDRIDIITTSDHPDINTTGSWHNIFPFAWITSGGWCGESSGQAKNLMSNLHKNSEYSQVVLENSLRIINFIQYLKFKKYRFYFMLMDNTILSDAPKFFIEFLEAHRNNNWITFDQYDTMHELALTNNMTLYDKFHPDANGHKLIAEYVYDRIKKWFE